MENFKPLAFEVFDKIKSMDIGDFFILENFIICFKLLPVPEIKTAVFISGTGSNLKNIIKFSKIKKSPISVDLIVSNTNKAKGLSFADQFNVKKKNI